jgi:hypothetical protein
MEIEALSDDELTDRLRLLVIDERRCCVAVVLHLAEFQRRQLAESKGFSNLFIYCTKVLGFSEEAAYKRIRVISLVKKFPGSLNRLEEGRITFNALVLLGPHLTSENHRNLLDWARGKTRRDIEMKVAALSPIPTPPAHDMIRALGPRPPIPLEPVGPTLFEAPAGSVESALAAAEPAVAGPASLRFGFTGSEVLLQKLERAKELLRPKYPFGRLEEIIGEALDVLLERKDPARKKSSARPRPSAGRRRRIPQWVKDRVFKRDGGSCAYVSVEGRRCGERGFLEYDHVKPWALGGASDEPTNIRLLCRGHNQLPRQTAEQGVVQL